MKKFIRILTVLMLTVVALTFTGCKQKKQYETKEVYLIANTPIVATEKEGCTFVGYYQLEESSKRAILYREGSIAPAGKYELIYVENSKKDITGKYSFPAMVEDGLTFAGWYSTEELKQGTRVTTNASTEAKVLYARFITFGDAALVTLVCIIIVFLMLALLCGIVTLLKFVAPKEKPVQQQASATKAEKALTMEDIKDDDMMAAALVATIDYHEETGENVRVVSIKEIK